jgi:hypothetical protein
VRARQDRRGGAGTADLATLNRLVVAARSWGIAPDPAPDPLSLGLDPAEVAERRLIATATSAHALLVERLALAPDTAAPSATEPSPAAAPSRDDVVEALRALVSPTASSP